ncbi:hypothetical protein [Anaeromyxobacter paludicola]|uniref:Uncharacterized protein n=1 Tax=Anaeromyxobacter paludicola TaxID=2918171 RepID=A0ABN6N481_9BACT|nr:hypothetical protein [Anaeromyxobacter paludicola]BDG07360.1 hypothetical protein AMPC_04730 [Anaeromyxobacter paludicola]
MDPKETPRRQPPPQPEEPKGKVVAPDIEEREEEGWSQPESSAQKEPERGPG